jgi:muramoyltetrapeptide carboxypeptidase LdcA involved in peptidoglycan recycling
MSLEKAKKYLEQEKFRMKKAAIVACSNAKEFQYKPQIDDLTAYLHSVGIEAELSDCIFSDDSVFSGTPRERAAQLMRMYKDPEIEEIYDISGGDVANGILPYLDYEVIGNSEKRFWGYSDLTTIINAIYAKTGKESILYQIRNLIYNHKEQQIVDFQNTVMQNGIDLFQPNYKFIQKSKMQGIVVGGNIRCFLKLAGTEYMPDLDAKILLLESYSGAVAKIETYLCQLQQIGAFDKVSGILLGTFTEMEEENCLPSVEELVKRIVGEDLPIAVTRDIGHGTDAKAIVIGAELYLKG